MNKIGLILGRGSGRRITKNFLRVSLTCLSGRPASQELAENFSPCVLERISALFLPLKEEGC